jgi:hypothetical protein
MKFSQIQAQNVAEILLWADNGIEIFDVNRILYSTFVALAATT